MPKPLINTVVFVITKEDHEAFSLRAKTHKDIVKLCSFTSLGQFKPVDENKVEVAVEGKHYQDNIEVKNQIRSAILYGYKELLKQDLDLLKIELDKEIQADRNKKNSTQIKALKELGETIQTIKNNSTKEDDTPPSIDELTKIVATNTLKLHKAIAHCEKQLEDSIKPKAQIMNFLNNIHKHCYNILYFIAHNIFPSMKKAEIDDSLDKDLVSRVTGALSNYKQYADSHFTSEGREHDELVKMHRSSNFRKK